MLCGWLKMLVEFKEFVIYSSFEYFWVKPRYNGFSVPFILFFQENFGIM